MRLFKKKILRSAQDDKPSLQDKVAKRIAGFGIKVQTKFADGMNKIISGVSTGRMKVLLVIFCLFWGGLSVYFIGHAVFGSKQPAIRVDRVHIPQHINKPLDEEIENTVDEETYQQIQDYKKYMDSTHQVIRAGLLDSMNVLEQIYLSQQKKRSK